MRRFLRLGMMICMMSFYATASVRAEDVSHRMTPHVWSSSLTATMTRAPALLPETPQAERDILDGTFLVIGSAERPDWTIVGEFNALDRGDDFGITTGDPLGDGHLRGSMMSLSGAYAIYQSGAARVEALAGLRHWDLDARSANPGSSAGIDLGWTDPIIGMRVDTPLGARAQFRGMANIGGFGVGSHHQLQVVAEVAWPVSDAISVAGGYSHLDIDFNEGTAVNMQMSGPFVAISLNF